MAYLHYYSIVEKDEDGIYQSIYGGVMRSESRQPIAPYVNPHNGRVLIVASLREALALMTKNLNQGGLI